MRPCVLVMALSCLVMAACDDTETATSPTAVDSATQE